MKCLLSKFLWLLILDGLISMVNLVYAQPSNSKQVLPIHIIKVEQTTSKLTSPSDIINSIRLKNEADTVYVKKDWQEDMGYVYALHYAFRDNLPNGIYRLYINDEIQEEFISLNGKKDGVHKSYVYGILSSETPFHNGKANGYACSYHQGTDALRSISYLYEDLIYIRTSIDLGGNVIGREYFTNGNHFRVEGKLFEGDEHSDSPLTKGGIVTTGVRNGLYELVSNDGRYQLFFDKDNIKWWRWLDKQGNKVVEVHAKPGQRL